MATEIRVPTLGESVSEATIGRWFKKPGDTVKADEPLVELETDKVNPRGQRPGLGPARRDRRQGRRDGRARRAPRLDRRGRRLRRQRRGRSQGRGPQGGPEGRRRGAAKSSSASYGSHGDAAPKGHSAGDNGPAVARLAQESGVDPSSVKGSGKDGRVTKGDMLSAISSGASAPAPAAPQAARAPSAPDDASREERCA